MRRTSVNDLLAPLLVVGVLVYVLLRFTYDSLPPLHLFVSLPVAALAVVEFVAARRVRAAVGHRPGARPMQAVVIARCVALGKASALVAAVVSGAALALIARVGPDAGRVMAASNDLRVGIAVAVAGGLLMAAGLLLERSALDPGRDDRS